MFDLNQAIGMSQAARMLRGRGGKAPSVDAVRRWANPKKGCRPLGQGGPVVVLRTVRVNGELLTLPEWVEAFEQERIAAGLRGGEQL